MPHRTAHDTIGYVDSHVHLDRYPPHQVLPVVERARRAGVRQMLTVGVDEASSRAGVELARSIPGVLAAVGIHPRSIRPAALDGQLEGIARVVRDAAGSVAAVGEIGLDAAPEAAPLAIQRRAFVAQLDMAAKAGLAVVVHSAGRHAETAEALRGGRDRLPAVIIHYFVGDERDARRFLALDCHLAFGRPLLKPGYGALRRAAVIVPDGRLLAETDSYPLPGRATEPRDVVAVVRALAAVRGRTEAEAAALTAANFRDALKLPATTL